MLGHETGTPAPEHGTAGTPHTALLDVAGQVIEMCRRLGCDSADVYASRSTDFEVKVADGTIVTLTQATSKGLGLRVFKDQRMGFCSTSDFNRASLQTLVQRALALAEQTAADPHNGLAELPPGHLEATGDLQLWDPAVLALSPEEKIRWAHGLEDVARATDARVRKFRDSGVATSATHSVLVTTAGSTRALRRSGISLWCTPVAQQGEELQTEVWYDHQTHLADLQSVELTGRTAALRAARMLGARSIKTQRLPVIFEPSMAAGLFGGMLGALDGDLVHKKGSFLSERLGEVIAHPCITLVDDPHLRRGTSSTPFDGEGLPTQKRNLLDQGKLQSFLYDTYTARKVGTQSTANAQRSFTSLPHAAAFNVYVQPGTLPPETIWKRYPKALVLTRGLGQGLNTVSGDYSRGANGLLIEHGEIVHPVQEVTIAGDFAEMLRNVDALGNDLRMRGSLGAPTLCVGEMTVSGASKLG